MPTQFDDSMKQFEALAQQYWKGWQELTQKAVADAPVPPAAASWQQGVDQWFRQLDPHAASSAAQGEMFERLAAGARQHAALMQEMLRKAGQVDANNPAGWVEAFRSAMGMPGVDPAFGDNPMAAALRTMGGQGAHDIGALLESVRAMVPDLGRQMAGMLDMPTFGLMREQQEQRQHMAAAIIDHQKQSTRFNALVLKASELGFAKFESLLSEREQPGRRLETVRAVYDLWVDAAEQAWEEVAMSAEFREVYGAMVDATMRLRGHVQREVESLSAGLGMPTRTEVDTLARRMHELRRQGRDRANAGTDAQLEELRRQLGELQDAHAGLLERLEQLQGGADASAAPPSAALVDVTGSARETAAAAVGKPAIKKAAAQKAAASKKPAVKKAAAKKAAVKKSAKRASSVKTSR